MYRPRKPHPPTTRYDSDADMVGAIKSSRGKREKVCEEVTKMGINGGVGSFDAGP